MLEIWSKDNFKVVYIVDYSISYTVFICHKAVYHRLFPHLCIHAKQPTSSLCGNSQLRQWPVPGRSGFFLQCLSYPLDTSFTPVNVGPEACRPSLKPLLMRALWALQKESSREMTDFWTPHCSLWGCCSKWGPLSEICSLLFGDETRTELRGSI